jgi:hypothetical protein
VQQLTLTANAEQVVVAVVERLLMRYHLTVKAFGKRPLGYIKGNKWQKLDAYIAECDDENMWRNMLAYYFYQFGNLKAAVEATYDEVEALESSLLLEGGWDGTYEDYQRAANTGAVRVRSEMQARGITPAVRAMDAVEREDRKPKPWIRGPLPPEAPAPFGVPLPQAAPLGLLPPPQMGQPLIEQLAPPAGVML